MRTRILFTLLATVSIASAQAEQPAYIQTLDAQMSQAVSQKKSSSKVMMKPQISKPKSTVDWPASASAPKRSTTQYRHLSPAAGMARVDDSGAIPALPLVIRTVGDIRYITGGVGDEEMAQLKMVKHDYNFRLLLTGIGGAYISDATVRIIDKSNRLLLSTDGAGPYLYATMPPGSYKLEITAPEGGIKTMTVKVPTKGSVRPQMRFTE